MLQYSNTPTSHLLDLDSAGEFLVMASTLMQIKSRMLLPRPVTTEEEEEEDPRAELVEMLLEYRRFKEAATSLRDYAEERQLLFTRPGLRMSEWANERMSETVDSPIRRFADSPALVDLSLSDLLRAVENLMRRRQPLIGELRRETFSVAEKVAEIEAALLTDERIPFEVFFPEFPSRLEIIVTFLALLEVVRKHRASVQQHRLFDVIYVCRPRPLPEPDPSEDHETTDHETTRPQDHKTTDPESGVSGPVVSGQWSRRIPERERP
jgi:segregation and condensation protein A